MHWLERNGAAAAPAALLHSPAVTNVSHLAEQSPQAFAHGGWWMDGAGSQANKLNIFISYSRDDLAFADQLRVALKGFGFRVTIDRDNIPGGDDWKDRLSDLIREADAVVFVLSPSSARSKICSWELEKAVGLGKRIVPALCHTLNGVNPPPQLADLQCVFFYAEPNFPGSGFGDGLARLASALDNPSAEARRKLLGARFADKSEASKPNGHASRPRWLVAAPYFVIVVFGIAVIVLLYYRSGRGVQVTDHAGAVITDHTGPVTMQAGAYWIRQLNVSYPGPVDVSIESIVPDWANFEGMKKIWIQEGKGTSPEIWFILCGAAEGDKCPDGVQRGVNGILRRNLPAGPATVKFYNFGNSPPVTFEATIKYPG